MRVGELTVASRVDASGLQSGLARMEGASRGSGAVMTGIFQGVGQVIAQTVISGVQRATSAVIDAGKFAALTTARYHELASVYQIIGKNAGYSVAQLDKYVAGLRSVNIEGDVAYGVLSDMARSQIDLSRATDLARVAQDAAVLSGEDSSETLKNLIYGIQTQNTEILRTHGIYVDISAAEEAYAKGLGKHAKDLTVTQKQQAVFNAVLESGKSIAGAYTTAMLEPGKVLRSMQRIGTDLAANIGEVFYPLLQQVVPWVYKMGQSLISWTGPGGAGAGVIKNIGDKLGGLFGFLKGVDLGSIFGAIGGIFRDLGPAFSALAAAGNPLMLIFKALGQAGGEIQKAIGGALVQILNKLAPIVPLIVEAFAELLGILTPLIPPLLEIADTILTALLDALEPILPLLIDLVESVFAALGPILPVVAELLKLVAGIFVQLLQAVAPLLPPLIELVQALLPVLVPILQLVIAVISQLVQWIGPILVGIIRDLVVPTIRWLIGVFKAVADAVGYFFAHGQEVIVNFLNSIINAAVGIWNWLRDVPNKIRNAVGSLVGTLTNAGRDLVQGLINGLAAAWDGIKRWISSHIPNLPGWIKQLLGIGSPSKVMYAIGLQITDGLRGGLDAGFTRVMGAWTEAQRDFSAVRFTAPALAYANASAPAGLTPAYPAGAVLPGSGTSGGAFAVRLEIPVQLDGHEITRVVAPDIVESVRRRTGRRR